MSAIGADAPGKQEPAYAIAAIRLLLVLLIVVPTLMLLALNPEP